MWSNKSLWRRIAVIASVVWVGVLIIVSVLARTFRWANYRGEPDAAFVLALVGVVLIVVVCFGIPWIAAAARKAPRE
jgi:hypothetical protein